MAFGMVMGKGGNGKGKPAATAGKGGKKGKTAKAMTAKSPKAAPPGKAGGMPMSQGKTMPASQMPNAKTIKSMKQSLGNMGKF